MENSIPRLILPAALLAGIAQSVSAEFLVNFDTTGDLTTNFAGFSDFAEAAAGGLADSGAVALTTNSQIAVYQTPLDLSAGINHTLTMYFQYNGGDGDGGTGRGFFIGYTSGASDTYDTSASSTGVDIRAMVSGSGAGNLYGINLQNDGTLVNASNKDIPLVIGNWYLLELVISKTSTGAFEGVSLALYDSSADGTVGTQLKVLDGGGAGHTLSSTLADAAEVYPFFGGQNPVSRAASTADNFAYTSEIPQPETTIFHGTPLAIDGVIDGAWGPIAANQLTIDIDGGSPEASDLSGYWKAMWDETYLYFLFVTEDDTVVAWPGSSFWTYDMTELFLDMDYSRNNDVVRYDENDFQIYFPRDGQAAQNNGPAPVSFPLNYAQAADGTLTVVELALPWSELTVTPADGMPIGVDVYMKDNDDGINRDNQISWSPSMDQAWKNPSLFGTAYLSAETATPVTEILFGTPTALDGAIDDQWNAVPTNPLTVDIDGSSPEATDLSGYWKAMWDETNIYFLFVTEDDTVVAWPGSSFWTYDMTELFLDMDYSRNNDVVRYDTNDFQIYFPRDGQAAQNNGPAPVSFPLNYSQAADGTLTIVELALPWSELTVTPSVGMPIGVDVYMKDNDDGTNRENQIAWSPSMDAAWKNPSLFGTGLLVADDHPLGFINLVSANAYQDGSYRSPWFGSFTVLGNWASHTQLGWLYTGSADDADSMYIYSQSLGMWTWTSQAASPACYDFAGARWVYFVTLQSGETYVYDYNEGAWDINP